MNDIFNTESIINEIFGNKFDSVLISPKKKKEFIEDILKLNPNIQVIYRKK